jgi:hypothetical protein
VVDVAVLVGGAPPLVGGTGEAGVGGWGAAAVGGAGRPQGDADEQAGEEERAEHADPGKLRVVVEEVVDGAGGEAEQAHADEQAGGDDHPALPSRIIGAGRWC